MVHPQLHQELGIDWSWDGETITRANGFLFQLQSPLFLVSFQILIQVLQILRELTVKLQLKVLDVASAYKSGDKIVTRLKSLRSNSVSEFNKQYKEATIIGKQLHGDQFELTTPRLTRQQKHRSNPPSSTPEEYSHVVSELEERFVNNPSHRIAVGLIHLLPSECIKLGDDIMVPDDLTKAADLFEGDLPHSVMLNLLRRCSDRCTERM